MTSKDLTVAQARKIDDQIRSRLGYLHRLKRRMEDEGFPIDDEIYVATTKAYNAMHELSVKMHYVACDADRRAS